MSVHSNKVREFFINNKVHLSAHSINVLCAPSGTHHVYPGGSLTSSIHVALCCQWSSQKHGCIPCSILMFLVRARDK